MIAFDDNTRSGATTELIIILRDPPPHWGGAAEPIDWDFEKATRRVEAYRLARARFAAEALRLARRSRPLPPRERAPRRRVRTCGTGTSRSARPPEALS